MPRNRTVISISLPPDLNAQLAEAARKTGKTKSRIIYEALIRYLNSGADGAVDTLPIPTSYQQPQPIKQNGRILSHEKFW